MAQNNRELSRKSNADGLTFQGKCPPYSTLVIHPFKAAPWLPRGEEDLSMEVKCFGFTTTFAASPDPIACGPEASPVADQGYNLGCLQVDSLPSEPQGKPQMSILCPLNPILTSGARSCSRKWTGRLGLEPAQYLPVDKENVILSIMGGEGSSWCKERPSR